MVRSGADAPTFFLSAGEESGDLHGASLARALRRRWPGARLMGLGGARMRTEGVELLAGLEDLAVMGVAEVVRHLPFFLRLRRRVFTALHEARVDLVIPIDYPGFNLRLAAYAHHRGIPVLYYIAPQVWAWHRRRVRELARHATGVAVVLPFEEAFFRSHGVRARFVGHPLLDAVGEAESLRGEWLRRHKLPPDRPLLALLPGSRVQEVQRHLPLFSEAAARIVAVRPEVQPVIAAPAGLPDDLYAPSGWPRVVGGGGTLLRNAAAAIVKSGTSTLEAALAGVPFVVAYQMNPLSFAIARRLVKVPHIALANLVAGARVVPEFVQSAATAGSLADAVLPLLDAESAARAEMLRSLGAIRARLGTPGAADRVAAWAGEILAHGALA